MFLFSFEGPTRGKSKVKVEKNTPLVRKRKRLIDKVLSYSEEERKYFWHLKSAIK